MALDLFTLLGTVKVDTGAAERKLLALDGGAKKTAESLDKAGDAAERAGSKIDKSAGRARDAAGRFVAAGDSAEKAAQRQQTAVDNLSSSLNSLAGDVTRIGTVMTASITLPLAGAAAAIISTGSSTETTLNRLEGTSRATADQMGAVRAEARALGADLSLPGTSAKDAAASMFELNKGGLDVEESMDAARGSIQLARAAMVDEATAAAITANALNTYNLEGDQAGRVSDALANAANKSTGEIVDFAHGLAQAGLVARSSNVDLEETLGVLSLLANQGLKGSDAGTAFKSFLLALRGPSDEARKALGKLFGKESPVYDGEGRMRALGDVVARFKSKLDTLTPESRDAFLDKVFGSDGARVAIALFSKGREELDKYTAAVGEVGAAQRVAEANTKGLAGAWDGLLSTIQTVAGDIYEDIKEPLTAGVRFITSFVGLIGDAWNSLGPGGKAFVATLLGIAAAAGPVLVVVGAVAGGLLTLAGSIASVVTAVGAAGGLAAIGAMLAPVIPIALKVVAVVGILLAVVTVAAAAIAAAWSTNFLHVRDLTLSVWEAVKASVTTALDTISQAWARVYPTLQSVTAKALAAVESAWENVGKKIVAAVSLAWSLVEPILQNLLKLFLHAVDLVLKVIDGDWDGAWVAFARVVVTAVDHVGRDLARLKDVVVLALAAAVYEILRTGERFRQAALDLALRFIYGFAEMMDRGKTQLTVAIVNALADAAAGVRVEVIAAAVGARFLNSLRQTIAQHSPAAAGPRDGAHNWAGEEVTASGAPSAPAVPAAGAGLRGLGFGGGGRRGGGGGGEPPAVKAARAELERLQTIFSGIERLQQHRLDDERYFFEEGLRSVDEYAAARQAAQLNILNGELRAAQQELAVARLTKGTWAERQNAVSAALEKMAAVRSKHEQALATIERDAAKQREEVARTAWANDTARLEEFASAQADIYRRLADQGVATFARAQQVIASAQMELLIREQVRLEKALAKLSPSSPQAQDIAGQLQTHLQKMEGFRARGLMDAGEADRRDLQRMLDHAARLREVGESIVDMEMETASRRLQAYEQSTPNFLRAERLRLDFELKAEDLRAARRRDALTRDRDFVLSFELNELRRAEIVEAVNRQIAASDAAAAANRLLIVEEFLNRQRDRLSTIADTIADPIADSINSGFEGGWRGALAGFKRLLDDMQRETLRAQVFKTLRALFNFQTAEESKDGKAGMGPTNPVMQAIAKALGINSLAGADSAEVRAANLNTQATEINTAALRDLSAMVRSGGAAGAAGGAGGFSLQGLLHELPWLTPGFNPEAKDSTPRAVRDAGTEAVGAVKGAGQAQAGAISETGDETTRGLNNVSRTLLTGLSGIAQMIASANSGGSFWKGLLVAAASGAVNGLIGGLTAPSSGGGTNPPTPPGLPPGGILAPPEFATGGVQRATSGGRLIRVAEAGYDELVLSTDPRHRARTAALLSHFIATTGIAPEVPSFGSGGYAIDGPAYVPAPGRPGRTSAAAAPAGASRPTINVILRPDRQGRIRSRGQVSVEVLQETETARRNA